MEVLIGIYRSILPQGLSLILTLSKCKISGEKISNFFQTKFFYGKYQDFLCGHNQIKKYLYSLGDILV
jgi:hypothetical protein